MIFAVALNCEELLLLNTWKNNCPSNIQILNYFDYHSDEDVREYYQNGVKKFKNFVNMFLKKYGILIPSLLADSDVERYVFEDFDERDRIDFFIDVETPRDLFYLMSFISIKQMDGVELELDQNVMNNEDVRSEYFPYGDVRYFDFALDFFNEYKFLPKPYIHYEQYFVDLNEDDKFTELILNSVFEIYKV